VDRGDVIVETRFDDDPPPCTMGLFCRSHADAFLHLLEENGARVDWGDAANCVNCQS
jgi:hypothetical protein